MNCNGTGATKSEMPAAFWEIWATTREPPTRGGGMGTTATLDTKNVIYNV